MRAVCVVVAILAGLVATTYYLSPSILAALAAKVAKDAGAVDFEITLRRPTLSSLHIERLEFAYTDYRTYAAGLDLHYDIESLSVGRALSVSGGTVTVELAGQGVRLVPMADLQSVWRLLPVDRLDLPNMVIDGDAAFRGAAVVDSEMLTVQGKAEFADSTFDVKGSLTPDGAILAEVGAPKFDLNLSGALTETGAASMQVGGEVALIDGVVGLVQIDGFVTLDGGRLKLAAQYSLEEFVDASNPDPTGLPASLEGAVGVTVDLHPFAITFNELTAAAPEIRFENFQIDSPQALCTVLKAELADGAAVCDLSGTMQAFDVTAPITAKAEFAWTDNRLKVDGQLGVADIPIAFDAHVDSLGTGSANFGGWAELPVLIDLLPDELLGGIHVGRGRAKFEGGFGWDGEGSVAGEADVAVRDLSGTMQAFDVTAPITAKAEFAWTDNRLKVDGHLGVADIPIAFDVRVDSLGTGSANFGGWAELPVLIDLLPDELLGGIHVGRGGVKFEGGFGWDGEGSVAGEADVEIDDAVVRYHAVSAEAVAAESEIVFDAGAWSAAQLTLKFETLDVGFPISNGHLAGSYSGSKLVVDAASVDLLGGQATVRDVHADIVSKNARVPIVVTGIDLGAVLALEGDNIDGTGVLEGIVPVTVADGRVTVVDSWLAAKGAGLIRYDGVERTAEQAGGLDFALSALEDFHYETLRVGVGYAADGELTLAVSLKGSNPNVEAGRPIHYNVNITENLPALLRSMRISDAVHRRIQARLTR